MIFYKKILPEKDAIFKETTVIESIRLILKWLFFKKWQQFNLPSRSINHIFVWVFNYLHKEIKIIQLIFWTLNTIFLFAA